MPGVAARASSPPHVDHVHHASRTQLMHRLTGCTLSFSLPIIWHTTHHHCDRAHMAHASCTMIAQSILTRLSRAVHTPFQALVVTHTHAPSWHDTLLTLTYPAGTVPLPKCALFTDWANRKACSVGAVGATCSTAGTYSRMCGVGYTGVKTYTCTAGVLKGAPSYWKEATSTCTGV